MLVGGQKPVPEATGNSPDEKMDTESTNGVELCRVSLASSQYSTLEEYLGAVRKVLQSRKDLSATWIEELIAGDDHFLRTCFEKQLHPATAAFDIFITEEEASRDPVGEDGRLKFDVNEKAKRHLQRLVELGLWGDSMDAVAKTLVEQSLAAKLESGLLRTTYPT